MSLSTRIAPHLPFLRRYARAVTGSQAAGDGYVVAVLEALIEGRLAVVDAARAQSYVDLWRASSQAPADEAQACLWQALIHELNQAPELARREYHRAIQAAPGNFQARLALAALVIDSHP